MSLVSVLVPMRNAEPFIRTSLESLLAQRAVELEVVVIDDGSTDGSATIVKAIGDRRVRVLPGPCRGIAAAFNAALAAARGDIVMRCDADDLYSPDRLAWQVRWLAEHREFGAVCGRFSTITAAGQPILEFESGSLAEEITDELRSGRTRTHLGTFAIRAELLRQLRGCRSYFVSAEDIDLQLRLGEISRVWFVPQGCYQYRLHGESITHRQGLGLMDFYEETARSFSAQRRAGQADALERGCPPPLPTNLVGKPVRSGEHIQGLLLSQAWEEHAAHRKLKALTIGLRACVASPTNAAAWKSLVALACKRAGRQDGDDSPARHGL